MELSLPGGGTTIAYACRPEDATARREGTMLTASDFTQARDAKVLEASSAQATLAAGWFSFPSQPQAQAQGERVTRGAGLVMVDDDDMWDERLNSW
jgi:hypothetical protein